MFSKIGAPLRDSGCGSEKGAPASILEHFQAPRCTIRVDVDEKWGAFWSMDLSSGIEILGETFVKL